MRVVVPYPPDSPTIDLVGEIITAEGVYNDDVTYDPILLTHPDAYRQLLARLWAQAESFILVEHDVLPWPTALRKLASCPGPWCGHSYWMLGGLGHVAFGCTKFGAALLRATSTIWDTLADTAWHDLDTQFTTAVHRALDLSVFTHAVLPHRHSPAVVHLNPRHLPQNQPARLIEMRQGLELEG